MSKVCDIALKAIKPTLDEMGVEVVDMEYKGGRKGEYPSLWIYVYHEDGVDLDLLEKVHRAIDPVLDEADPTDNAPYTLNVSSPVRYRGILRKGRYSSFGAGIDS